MGILHSGPFGGISGKTGPLVGRRQKHKNVITGLHHWVNRNATAEQMVYQAKLRLLMSFLTPITPLINIGFRGFRKGNTAINAAFRFNFDRVFSDQGSQPHLKYEALVYSRGNIYGPLLPSVEPASGGLLFSWKDEPSNPYCYREDSGTFVVYNAKRNVFETRVSAARRGDLSYLFEIPASFSGEDLHCYMNFNDLFNNITGTSFYVGSITENV
ncbi:DUF6266 family protein [Pedobacter deserti]|uniref:DUF6266 family protein n=1 Tax=Pedobacter deserti TaxID=2817382 RepID=UPI00210BB249|nr:DUF6266 family protein [Pedobacter sp. SYSU D00382]